ncbi:TPA: hypothetical protein MIM71_25800 [Klebsiella variicola]|nr:hypothetical protein [Klebsiella variicola]HBX9995023.1 hypothetical protein [Klebsiella variicola]
MFLRVYLNRFGHISSHADLLPIDLCIPMLAMSALGTKQTLKSTAWETSGCRVSGMEAPAEAAWSTEGKWRRRPAQPAAVLTGSAYPTPFPCI